MRVAVIPARGGSKRIPRKNIRLFHGKPIIAYSIETAKKSNLFDRIIVSTEDAEIAEVAEAYGAETIKRPTHLAEIGVPDCGTQEVARHVVKAFCEREDYACCIYATAPFMTAAELSYGFDMLCMIPFAQFAFSVGDPLCDAGQWYWGRASAFLERRPLISPLSLMIPVRTVLDINTEEDWVRAEQLWEEKHERQ